MAPRSKTETLVSTEDGATLIEYGIMLMLIAAVLVSLTATIGQITLKFFDVAKSL